MNPEQLKAKMDEAHYIYDDTLATVLAVAPQLGRPLLQSIRSKKLSC